MESPILELRWSDGLPEIETERLNIRLIREGEADKLARYRLRNRARFQPWEVLRPESHYDEVSLRGIPRMERDRSRAGLAFAFRLLHRLDDTDFIGNISLRDVLPFPNHSAVLGYALDQSCEGKGIMREGLAAVIEFGQRNLNLRRLEACCMPANQRSISLLTRAGFEREGLLRSSYFVNSNWEDHILWSLINPNWVPSSEDL